MKVVDDTKKQNILIVHNFYQIPGGEDTVVANEMKMLEDHGHKVILYTRSNNELKNMGLLRKLLLPFTTIFNPKTYRDIKRLIRQENVEIVHVHNTLNLISPAVYYAAKKMKVPVVQTVHNFRLLCPGATFYRDGHICEDCSTKGLGCAIKHSCYRGSKVQTLICVIGTLIHRMVGIYGKINYICLTEFNKEKLLNIKQIKEDRVFVKPNFVEAPKKQYEKNDSYVFVGRIEEIKGITDLLEAWKKLGSDAPHLIVCGTGPLLEECKKYVNDNNIISIDFLGFVPHEDVMNILSQSRYLVLPTRVYEGFPMTIVEAYSVGTPVIVPDLGNAGDIIKDSITGYKYKVGDIRNIADCIKKSLTNYHLGNLAYQEYLDKYTEEANNRMLETIYHDIILSEKF